MSITHNPESVSVEFTGPESPYCIRITLDDLTIYLHTRSAIDLEQKLGTAISDWIAAASAAIIAEIARART